jgi:hypothetical protein
VRFFSGKDDVLEQHTVSIFSSKDGDGVSPKCWYLPMRLYGVTTHKTNIVIRFGICLEELRKAEKPESR